MSETTPVTETVTDDLDAFTADFFGQKSTETPPASGEVEQEAPKPDEVEDDEPQNDTEDAETEDEPAQDEPPKKKPTFQDRINELVKQREDEKREGERRLAELRKEFEDQINALKPKPAEQKAAEPTPDDLKEDGTNKYPLGEFDPAYIRDLTRFTLAQERAQADQKAQADRQRQEQETAQATLDTSWQEKLTAAKIQYPDLDEKAQAGLSPLNNIPQDYAMYLANLIKGMDKGPDVLYYLANNPAEAATIVNSGAQRATLALGRIEAKFIEADAQKQLAKPKVSKAPPPPPVQSRGSAAGYMGVTGDTDDLDAFAKEFFQRKKY